MMAYLKNPKYQLKHGDNQKDSSVRESDANNSPELLLAKESVYLLETAAEKGCSPKKEGAGRNRNTL